MKKQFKFQLSVRTILISLVLFLGVISLLGMFLGQLLLSQGNREAQQQQRVHTEILEIIHHLGGPALNIQVLALSSVVERSEKHLLQSAKLPGLFFKQLDTLEALVEASKLDHRVASRLELLRTSFRNYMREIFNTAARLLATKEHPLKWMEQSRFLLQQFDAQRHLLEEDIEEIIQQYALSYEQEVKNRERRINIASLMVTILILLLLLVLWVLSVRFFLPIKQLRLLAQQIASGDYSVEMVWPYQDELGAIADSFNEMSAAIRQGHSTIEHEHNRLERLLQSTPEALIQVDIKGRIKLFNHEASQLLDYPADRLLGAPFGRLIESVDLHHPLIHYLQRSQLLSDSDWGEVKAQLHLEAAEGGTILRNLKAQYRKKGGEKVPVLVNVSLLEGGGDEPESLIIVAKDISEVVEQQQKLLDSQRALTSILHDIKEEERYKVARAMELVTTVVSISEGELELQADTGERNDLFRDMANGVNRMSSQIRNQIKELRESHRHLHDQTKFVRGVIHSMPEAIATIQGGKITTMNRHMKLLYREGQPETTQQLLQQLHIPPLLQQQMESQQQIDQEYSIEVETEVVKRYRLQRLNLLRQAYFRLNDLQMERLGMTLDSDVRKYLYYPGHRLKQAHHGLSIPMTTTTGEKKQFSLSLIPFYHEEMWGHQCLLLVEDLSEIAGIAEHTQKGVSLLELQQLMLQVKVHKVALFNLQHQLLAANQNYLQGMPDLQVTEQGVLDKTGKPLCCYQVSHGSDRPCWEIEQTEEEHPCPIHDVNYQTPTSGVHLHLDSGQERRVSLTYSPIRNQDGEVWAVLESMHDITLQRSLADEIQYSGTLDPTLLEQPEMPAALLVDGWSNIQFLNKEAERTLNVEAELLLDQPLALLFSNEQEIEQSQLLVINDVTEQHELEQAERTAAYQGGLAEMGANVLHNIGNAVSGLMHRAQSLGQSVKRLEEMEQALEAGLKVDDPKRLQQGLQMAITDLREVRLEGVEKIREAILSTTDHMADIISLQQSLSAERAFYVSSFSLERALRDGVRMQEDSNQKYHVRVQMQISNEIDEVELPYNPFMQMIGNFIKNSREAIQQYRNEQNEKISSFEGVLAIQVKPIQPDRFNIEIIDNGCGIAPNKLKSIFQRGETTKERGTGFGLHSVATFVQSIDGMVLAKNREEGHGAHMVIELPLSAKKALMNSNSGEKSPSVTSKGA